MMKRFAPSAQSTSAGAAIGGQDAACRILVGRGHEDRVGVGARELVDTDPGRVDRDPDDLEARRPDRPSVLRVRRILDGDPSRTRGAQHLRHERQGLGEASGDDDVGRVGDGSAGAVQVCRQGVAQLRRATPVDIAEPLAGRLGQGAPERAQPEVPRELVEVGAARPEVDDQRRRRRFRRCGPLRWPASGRRA